MDLALWLGIALPLGIALLLALGPLRGERTVARLALGATALSAAASALALALWLVGEHAHPHRTAPLALSLLGAGRCTLPPLLLDGQAAVFLALVQFISGLVLRFSRYYLHREPGFRRFFATVLLFQSAMELLALAAHLDLMFAAWELVGLSSFLLIAFYRERQSAARSALKTYSVYRVADVGMLLAAVLEGMGDELGHGGGAPLGGHLGLALGLCVLVAAIGKSAQFPFSFWVARAMEGPTPSSALFYGALSVHAGAYLLLRTFALWSGVPAVRVCVGLVGLVTAVTCSMYGRVQPTIKGQIAYASVTQVGLVFVEIALGLPRLALLHVVCNALLRCYQLLVSPSVVAHRLRRQATAGAARSARAPSPYLRLVPERWRPTLYVYALSEGYQKELSRALLWSPWRRLGARLHPRALHLTLALLAVAGTLAVLLDAARGSLATLALLVLALGCSARGLERWRQPLAALAWTSASSLLGTVAVLALPASHTAARAPAPTFYTLGLALACLCGFAGSRASRSLSTRFAGLAAERPVASALSLVGALGLAGTPPLPTFWGEDRLVHAALVESPAFAAALAGLLALNGYLAVRSYAYAFFGPPALPVRRPRPDDLSQGLPLPGTAAPASHAAA